jgi:hypothetical protein
MVLQGEVMTMPTRSVGKKIALSFSIFGLIGMFASIGVFIYFHQTKGMMDVLTASAMATSLFFASVAVVLYFISKPPLHELLPWDAPDPESGA